jgi:seryl-tRNA synthetase
MFDVKYIIEDPERIKKGIAKKHSKADIDKLVKLYEKRKEALLKIESLRARQNEVSKEIPKAKDKKTLIEEMSKVKEELKKLEPEIEKTEQQIDEIALLVPNPTLDSVPEGEGDEGNKVIKTHGKKPTFDFTPKDHIELGKHLNIIDIERAVRASGTRFYYLKNEAVLLEFALVQHIMHKLVSKGFSPIIPPVLVKEEAMLATGFFPADRNEIYHVNPKSESNPDGDDLFLVGTAEVPLNMIHYTEILEEEKLPLRYCGFSSCFRREAGSYGKDTAGIFRVHQFDKLEMFSFCHPDKSEEEHEFLRGIEEEIMQELDFHYQVVNICGGDLGAPAAKKYDIEVWIPTQNKFRELTSCSNCTDFQARRSHIRYKNKKGQNLYIHTLNGTAMAMARTLVAILENYQNKDGSVTIPEILQPYLGGQTRVRLKDGRVP